MKVICFIHPEDVMSHGLTFIKLGEDIPNFQVFMERIADHYGLEGVTYEEFHPYHTTDWSLRIAGAKSFDTTAEMILFKLRNANRFIIEELLK